MRIAKTLLVLVATLGVGLAWAQDTPASNMEILKEKVRADKKLVVAVNTQLTDSEAEAFWPVYDAYQAELAQINERIRSLISDYAAAYRTNTLDDAGAKKLIDEALAIEQAEVALKKAYVPKLMAVLPAKKAARYLQIENKIRALGKYELAAAVPLAE